MAEEKRPIAERVKDYGYDESLPEGGPRYTTEYLQEQNTAISTKRETLQLSLANIEQKREMLIEEIAMATGRLDEIDKELRKRRERGPQANQPR